MSKSDVRKEEEFKKKAIYEVEQLAKEVLDLKQQSIPRRPLVIEFCGSPKAGKTSCISSLELLLRRNGFRTRLLSERAGICPVRNKFDPYFNIWTVSSAMAELSEILSNHPKDYDVVIMDRGVFDGLCWFSYLRSKGHLDSENYSSLEAFLTMNRLRSVLDLVFVFTASADISLVREYANLLTEKTGSIMTPPVLNEIVDSVKKTASNYTNTFRNIELYDTSEKNQNLVSYEVTLKTLHILRENIEEKIGYFERSSLYSVNDIHFRYKDIVPDDLQMQFGPRHLVEDNSLWVQPIPILVIHDEDMRKVLVVKKNKKSTSVDSPEANKSLIYLGGHIRREDQLNKEKSALDIAKIALAREVKEEIGIDYNPSVDQKDPMCIWIRDNKRSEKHLAVCFLYSTSLDSLKINLDKNEFMVGGNSKSGKIYDVNDLLDSKIKLEPWSEILLSKIFGVDRVGLKDNLFSN